jgi:hypothetical protein
MTPPPYYQLKTGWNSGRMHSSEQVSSTSASNGDYVHPWQEKEYRGANSDSDRYQPPAPVQNSPFIDIPATATRPQSQPSQSAEWQRHVEGNRPRGGK